MLVWSGLALGCALLVLFALPSYRLGEASIAGKTAEDFTLTVDGKPRRLSDYRGKVVVLNFWASYCQPCVEEAPSLNRLQRYLEPRGGTILGVSLDPEPSGYEKFIKDFNVPYPTWRDPNLQDGKSKIALNYGTSLIPETYVVDRRGRIARKLVSAQQWDSQEMLAYFEAILKEK
ncbi:MAG TPA: TlpA disulfide reductase family protein [Candidatus Eisenbacteria bacterium]|nr:TlpA disulfide reductase family protein [Candidatus Eisenbacteria bacterium]